MRSASLWLTRFLFVLLIATEVAALTGLLPIRGEYNWFGGLTLTALVAWAATEAVIYAAVRRSGPPIPGFIPLLPAAAVYLDALGDFVHWYAQFAWYDQLTHFAGGAGAAGLLYIFFKSWIQKHGYPLNHKVLAFITVSATALAGSLYEIEEYLEDALRQTPLRLGDGPDTASDLLFSLLGALAAVILVMATSSANLRSSTH